MFEGEDGFSIMSVLCTICARGGSKGVSNKNIKNLMGKPLIAYTIEQALRFQRIDRVVVSTDSVEIARIAKELGAEIPFMRPSHLATDTAAKLPVIRHAVEYYMKTLNFKPDYIIDLDPTSPLRTLEDIKGCMDLIELNADCESVITGYRSNKNPYFNMVEIGDNGFAKLSKSANKHITDRQHAPAVFAMNASVYVWKTDVLRKQESIISGNIKFFEMPEERSIDIDSEIDFKFVELLMKENVE